jgi:WASH complex subunit 7
MAAEDRWETDPFDDGSSKLVGERQLQMMKEFEDLHVAELQRIWQRSLSAIGKSDHTAKLRTGHVRDPIGLWFQPYEQANLLELVKTDNKLFNKMTQTFAALSNEMELLSEEGSAKFYAPLALFGHVVTDEDRREAGELPGENETKVPGDTEEANEGEAQVWMGRMWPLLVSLGQFVHRSYAVVSNTIRQLASVYHPSNRLYVQSFQHIHLSLVFQKLFKLLTVLVTFDEIIALNDQLPTCWGMYKRMLKTVAKDPSKYQVQLDDLFKFEKLMFDIQSLLMDGQIFRNCIEQEFDLVDQGTLGKTDESGQPIAHQYPPFKIEVRNNDALAREFFYQLRQMEDFLALEAQMAANTITGLGGSGFASSALTAAGTAPNGTPLTNTLFADESSNGTAGGRTYVGTCILFALWFSIWKQQDDPCRKLFRALYEHAKKVPMVHLYGMAAFDGPTMLNKHAPALVTVMKLTPATALTQAIRTQYINSLNADLATKTRVLYFSVSRWLVRMESVKPNEVPIEMVQEKEKNPQSNGNASHHAPSGLPTSMALLAQGLKLASAASLLVKHILTLHTIMGQGMKAAAVPYLFELLHLVKAVQGTIMRHRGWIGRLFATSHGEITEALSGTLNSIQTSLLKAAAQLPDSKLDQLAASTLGLGLIQQGPPTSIRVLLVVLAIQQCGVAEYYTPAEQRAIQVLLARLVFISRFLRDLREVCDTSFLFFYMDLLPVYLKHLFQAPQGATKLPYTFQVLGQDIPHLLLPQSLHESPAVMLANFRRTISKVVLDHIVQPLCNEIESDLRNHTFYQSDAWWSANKQHRDLAATNQMDPFKQGIHDVLPFLHLPPLQLHGFDLDIKTFVQHYLDTNFYNVNTVALYDWQNYTEMRNLALAKYGLELQPVHLPGQTLEQGVDILIIMRKIHVFTSGYSYNLNNQLFVQRSSDDNKTLNTINIQHIANSIRTHGTGIMNTTINFTFQFLKQKFAVFSQFLFDERIKSMLFREIRHFTENKEQLNSTYPWDRADKLVKDIRKLGMLPDGMSYLDKFRVLITEIGNAMGYVRMIRSGGLLHTSNAIKFVPDIEGVVKFAPLFLSDAESAALAAAESSGEATSVMERPANVSQETWDSALNLDSIIGALKHNFTAEGTDYFRMIVSVFSPQFHSEANLHLKNFFIIIPALTVSFCESMLSGKERMNKYKKGSKSSADGHFTDDGFAIGVAFILKLLDQDREFESLHWFQSILAKLEQDEKEAQAADTAAKSNDTTSLTRLTLNRIRSLITEYNLLRASLTGARVFFAESGKSAK